MRGLVQLLSWLLNPQRPEVLPAISRPETSDRDDAVSHSDTEREEAGCSLS